MTTEDSTCCVRSIRQDSVRLSSTCSRKQEPQREKAESNKTQNDQKAREMQNKHEEPDGEHNASSYFGKETQHPFECVVIVPRSQ